MFTLHEGHPYLLTVQLCASFDPGPFAMDRHDRHLTIAVIVRDPLTDETVHQAVFGSQDQLGSFGVSALTLYRYLGDRACGEATFQRGLFAATELDGR